MKLAGPRASHIRTGNGGKGIRTPDPLLAKQVLSQLSYTPALRKYYLLTRLALTTGNCRLGIRLLRLTRFKLSMGAHKGEPGVEQSVREYLHSSQ